MGDVFSLCQNTEQGQIVKKEICKARKTENSKVKNKIVNSKYFVRAVMTTEVFFLSGLI